MSLPISPAGAILTAIRSAGSVARGIQSAVSFDKLIQAEEPKAVDMPLLIEETLGTIRDHLKSAGIALNPPIRLSVQESGRLQLTRSESDPEHPRGAEIELLLGSDDQLRQLAWRLRAAGGPAELAIGDDPAAGSGLTHLAPLDNIKSSPGGYANW